MIIKVIVTDDNGKDHGLGVKSEDITQEKFDRAVDVLFSTVKNKIKHLREGIDAPWPKHL